MTVAQTQLVDYLAFLTSPWGKFHLWYGYMGSVVVGGVYVQPCLSLAKWVGSFLALPLKKLLIPRCLGAEIV